MITNKSEAYQYVTNDFFNVYTTNAFFPLRSENKKDLYPLAIKTAVDMISKNNQVISLWNNTLSKYLDNDFNLLNTKGLKIKIPDNILIIGAGGIGSWFMPKFVKLLNDAKRKNLLPTTFNSVTICDGDEVEDSNLIRQNFATRDVGRNKAEALFRRYSTELNGSINFGYIDKYILDLEGIQSKPSSAKDKFVTYDSYYQSLIKGSLDNRRNTSMLVINLIDNNESRKGIHAWMTSMFEGAIASSAVVDVANSTYNGQLNFTLYGAGSELGARFIPIYRPYYWDMITENIFLNDKISVFDCSRADVQAVEQLFDVNNMAATVLCSYMNTWIEKTKIFNAQVSFTTGPNISIKTDYKLYDIFFDTYAFPANRRTSQELTRNLPAVLSPVISSGNAMSKESQFYKWVNIKDNMKFVYGMMNMLHSYRADRGDITALETFNIDFAKPESMHFGINQTNALSVEEASKLLNSAYTQASSNRQKSISNNEIIISTI